MIAWIRRLGREVDETTGPTISAAAAKAEAQVLVGEIRANLDRLEDVVEKIPDDSTAEVVAPPEDPEEDPES